MDVDNKGLSDADIIGYMQSLSSWGKWGNEDQRGALNYITPQKRAAAAELVRDGDVVAVSLPLPTAPGRGNPRPVNHFMIATGESVGAEFSADYFGMICHG